MQKRTQNNKCQRLWSTMLIMVLCLTHFPYCFGQPKLLPSDADYVSDQVGIVDERTREEIGRLNRGLSQVGAQIVVAVIPSLEGYDLESYANQLFRTWEIGDEEEDNGILLLIAYEDRKFRIEVGRGLEGAIPDGKAGSILRQDMAPAFQAGNYSEGIYDAVQGLAGLTAEEYGLSLEDLDVPEPNYQEGEEEDMSIAAFIAILIMFLVFVRVTNARRRGYGGYHGRNYARDATLTSFFRNKNNDHRGPWGGSGGFFGGGGGGGGGFSGGGGSSGGGGASGGW